MSYITLKDVAKKAGVSLSAASRALNGRQDVSEETRKRISETARALGYVPNRFAASLKFQKTHTIGVIIEDNANPFWAEVLKGVESQAQEKGYQIILANTSRSYEREVRAIQTLIQRRVDGLLIAPNQEKYDDLFMIRNLGVPFVIIGRHIKEFEPMGIPMVYSDEVDGGYRATRHLIERGCKKIAFVGAQPYNTASIERCEGYKMALKEAGIEIGDRLIKTGGIEIDGGYKSVMELIRDSVKFDGIFAYNDLMAFGVIKALKENKIKIPQEVKVIGYDDIPFSALITPSLTTMRIQKQEMGKESFEILSDRKTKILDTVLIERESSSDKHENI
ncbi:MAG: LacI family DNA-binding transcriptional regulator [Athalassotoga sp.]|uniref:LacI family DNA-binding transcriptional regulator n=1 Tax=Athalassotoga sp. TaxID=2022597 RepID=UPI003D0745B5